MQGALEDSGCKDTKKKQKNHAFLDIFFMPKFLSLFFVISAFRFSPHDINLVRSVSDENTTFAS